MEDQYLAPLSAQTSALRLVPDRAYTEKELEAFGIASRSTLRKLRMQGKTNDADDVSPKFFYVGRNVKYWGAEVLAWIERRQVSRACQRAADDPRRTAATREQRDRRALKRAIAG